MSHCCCPTPTRFRRQARRDAPRRPQGRARRRRHRGPRPAGVAGWPGRRRRADAGHDLVLINLDGGCDTLNIVIPSDARSPTSRRARRSRSPPARASRSTGGPGPRRRTGSTRAFAEDRGPLGRRATSRSCSRSATPTRTCRTSRARTSTSFGVRNGFGRTRPPGERLDRALRRPLRPDAARRRRRSASGAAATSSAASTTRCRVEQPRATFRFQTRRRVPGQPRAPAGQTVREHARERLDGRGALRRGARRSTDGARRWRTRSRPRSRTTPGPVPLPATRARIGSALKDVAALIQGGFETRVFYIGLGGFDTHGDQGATRDRAAQAALFTEHARRRGRRVRRRHEGAWACGTTSSIVVLTEFGRRNYENGSVGTDHGAARADDAHRRRGQRRHVRAATSPTPMITTSSSPTRSTSATSTARSSATTSARAASPPCFPESQPISTTLA